MTTSDATTGCLLGTAVGDALGLPREGLRPERARRLFGDDLRHAMLLGRGLVSDDTDHAAMTAAALLTSGASPEAFARALAGRLRLWMLALPPGVGLATARACLKLCLGVAPDRSGVFSAGNGPMMRAPIIGVALAADPIRMREFVAASTRITHTDPRAERAAYVAALAASWTLRNPDTAQIPAAVLADLQAHISDDDDELNAVLARCADPEPLTNQWPYGPGGYAYHTLLAVLHSWLHNPRDFAAALCTVIALGGDADTTGAILGGIAGASLGPQAIPPEWLQGLAEWPRSVKWLRELAERLGRREGRPPGYFWPAVWPRNAACLVLMLSHAAMRLLKAGGLR